MKNKVLFVILIFIVILSCIRVYIVNRTYSQLDLDKMNGIDTAITNIKFDDVTYRGVGIELVYAIENVVSWDILPLTDEFKNKYKNGKGIMPEKDKYSMFSVGMDNDDVGRQRIIIFADHKQDFFDFTGDNSKTTKYYYTYELNEDNKLNDIELVHKVTIDSTTGEPIEE